MDGNGRLEHVQYSTSNQWPLDWSDDGRFLLYLETLDFSNGDLYALPMSGDDRTPVPIAATSFSEESAAFSPAGRWVAYSTDRSGRDEIVAQSFPDSSRSIQLSLAGGRTPHWSTDGREVVFVAPVALFQTQLGDQWGIAPYDLDKNGRVLMDRGNQPAPPIRLLLNWMPAGSN